MNYKWILQLAIIPILFYGAKRFCDKKTEGFQIYKILSHLAYSKEWETQQLQDHDSLHALFSQPFHYLSSGGQCYAFVSTDGKWVLKFYKMHNLRQYPFLYKIALPGCLDRLRIQILLHQQQKLRRIFSSSILAYDYLKEETGLLSLNLNPKPDLKGLEVKLIDKLGIAHQINLWKVPFALQQKADNAFKRLRSYLLAKDTASAKIVVKEIVAYLTARYNKGIQDLDPALRRNVGLLRDRAIAVDIGSFYLSDSTPSSEEMQKQLMKETKRMRKWLDKRSPELRAYFDGLTNSETALKNSDASLNGASH